ncbi:espin [Atheta coriaria]|uniref:espin n=1 Tax=Dalotia coriaria TaxID=877792 RepID=UPI0031F43CFB
MDNDVTPVYLAAQEGHLEVLKFLVLEAGGSLYVRAKDGMAPIHAASQMGCLNCVKWMIQDQGVDPNLRDGDGATPLHFAASRGHLETVRWLLKHGARLSLDKYGKSPINDAAENQQVECLNVLVQHGTTPDYKDANGNGDKKYASCSCARNSSKRSNFDCSTCKRHQAEPFYLHPPLARAAAGVETPHAPQDGLYINPMGVAASAHHHRHASAGSDCGSASSTCSSTNGGSGGGESFYLHNPQEVIYNRVKDLFPNNASLSALTVKVEVHSSSSGAGSDENTSSAASSSSEGGGAASGDDHDHDYEDIYMVRDEHNKHAKAANRSRSRDSGSHSRSGSASSGASTSASGCNVIVKLTTTNSASPASTLSDNDYSRHKPLGKAASMPPPPPPLPSGGDRNTRARPTNTTEEKRNAEENSGEDEQRGTDEVEILEEPSVRPSDVVKGMCRSMSALSAKRLNSSCSDLTIISLDSSSASPSDASKLSQPTLAGKTRVLPFVPPSFPQSAGASATNHLIKPSEYLKSIGKCDGVELLAAAQQPVATSPPPPLPPPLPESQPPPLPPPNRNVPGAEEITQAKKKQQPLSAISIHDINSVQLRRIDNKMAAGKTFSAPVRSMSLQSLTTDFVAQKTDLIAELKMSKDITGIKKMKIERAKVEEKHEKEMYTEISKQYSTTNFVEKIPDKDNTGNAIPAWKRQMLAKKAAERARKELEEQLQREAEEKRLSAIPQWKRQLMAKKEEAESKIRHTLYTPKVEDPSNKATLKLMPEPNNNNQDEPDYQEEQPREEPQVDRKPREEEDEESNESSEEEIAIIPWRAQLRKTNSKLNLLD